MAAAEVARLVAKLEADVRDFDRDMKKAEKRLGSLEKNTKKTNQAMKKTGGVMGGLTDTVKKFGAAVGIAFAGKAVLDFARDTIRAASDLEESINAVEVTFGEAAAGIKQLGEEAATTVGLSNEAFNSLAVGFSAFVEKIDQGGGNVVGIMDDLTTRVADFASVMNLEVAEAGNIFRSALAGETEAIRRFGVDVSAAAVNAKAMALGLAESSAELSEQDKILARYQLVMEQTNKTAGDFANTSGSLANVQRQFTAELENMKARIGEALLPAMTTLLQTARDLLPVFEEWATQMAEVAGQVGPLIGLMGKLSGVLSKKFVPANWPLLALGTGIEELVSWFDESVQSAQHVQTAIDKIGKESDGSSRQVAAFVEGIKTITTEGELTEDVINDLVFATEFYEGQLEDTLGATLEWMRATGQSTTEIMALEQVLSQVIDALDLTEDEVNALRAEFGLASREISTADHWITTLASNLGLIEPPDKDVKKEFSKIASAAKIAADKIAAVRTKIRELTDPAFRALQAQRTFDEGAVTLGEAITEHGLLSPEAVAAGEAQLENTLDLLHAADELDQVSGVGLATFFAGIAAQGEVPLEIVEALHDELDELDGWTGVAEFLLKLASQATADFERDVARANVLIGANVGEGAPTPIPIPNTTNTRASGGPVTAGSPFIVGEQGPELFVPSQSGQIIPNDQMGGSSITLNVGEMTEDLLDETIEDLLGASLTLNAETR